MNTFKTPTATNAPRVLVVDRDANLAETVADGLVQLGFDTEYVTSSREATRLLDGEPIDALVTNLRMPELDGIELLRIAKLTAPSCPVILMTECGTVDLAVAAMRQGAYHCLLKPFLVRELALFNRRAHPHRARTQCESGSTERKACVPTRGCTATTVLTGRGAGT
jgi:DNA-binding NtrC family response regulator